MYIFVYICIRRLTGQRMFFFCMCNFFMYYYCIICIFLYQAADRTVRVTDLDTLLALGNTPPEGSGVVGCGFARDGSALFSVGVWVYVCT